MVQSCVKHLLTLGMSLLNMPLIILLTNALQKNGFCKDFWMFILLFITLSQIVLDFKK